MNQDLKTRWLAALRSGEYRQGRGRLRDGDGDVYAYCCLGVLADLIDSEGWDGCDNSWKGRMSYLPESLAAGLIQPETEALAVLNDSGASFAAIADVIEKDL
jgi:hypothetical protein